MGDGAAPVRFAMDEFTDVFAAVGKRDGAKAIVRRLISAWRAGRDGKILARALVRSL